MVSSWWEESELEEESSEWESEEHVYNTQLPTNCGVYDQLLLRRTSFIFSGNSEWLVFGIGPGLAYCM